MPALTQDLVAALLELRSKFAKELLPACKANGKDSGMFALVLIRLLRVHTAQTAYASDRVPASNTSQMAT